MNALACGGAFARLVLVPVREPSVSFAKLQVGLLRRAFRMELRLTPWSSESSLVELLPRERRVPLTQAYFDAGNRYLDQVVRDLEKRADPLAADALPNRARSIGSQAELDSR